MNTILGLDVSKEWLDACFYEADHKPVYHRFINDPTGHNKLIDYLTASPVKLVVCEPTGGYERTICEQFYASNIRVHQVDTCRFSAFSKSMDRCKTDKHDAFKLAFYGYERKLKANYTYQSTTDKLKRQQQRREDLVAALSKEKKRLHHSQPDIDKESIERSIEFFEQEIKIIDQELNKTITSSNQLEEKTTILQTIPGIGHCLATKLVSSLPELGDSNYSSNQLSALVGIAPHASESGKKEGKRFISGGRKIPRDALYMAVLAGRKAFVYLKMFYDRLVAKYKPKKLAIVACMRKLLELAHKLIQQKRNFVKNTNIQPKMDQKLAS